MIHTDNLSLGLSGLVWVHSAPDDEWDIGHIDDCEADCPEHLLGELQELRQAYRDATDYGRACDATARSADAARHSPERW